MPLWPDPERFARAVALFAGAGFQCATHAIGDRAVRCTLDAYRAAGAAPGIRHRIEHIETLGDEQLARFAAEGVTASMQAIHLQWLRADGSDPWSRALGAERAGRAFRCADLVASGALRRAGVGLAGRALRPARGHGLGAAAAPARRSAIARPSAPARRSRPSSRCTATRRNAWQAVGEEAHAGRIAVGYRADLTAFAADPVECPADDLPDLPVRLTVVAGEPVHRQDA